MASLSKLRGFGYRRWIFRVSVYIALALAGAGDPAAARYLTPYVIDGDTLVFGREHVRIANLDAPDIGDHAKCELERQRGMEARSYAWAIIRRGGSVVIVSRQGLDRYRRTLARVLIDGQDFGDLMIAAGHGRPWRGRSSDWCV